MAAFVFLYIYLFFIWLASNNIVDKLNKRRFQCVASGFGLIFLLGLHSPTLGCDIVGSYAPAFERTGQDFIASEEESIFGFELGFMNYMALVHHITDDVQMFLFISSIIIVVPVIYVIYMKSRNVMMSVMIYVSWYLYYFSFSGLRQSIAISVCAIATIFIFKKKILPFVLIVIGASFIHTSALLFILAYALYNYKISNKKILLAGTLLIAVLLVFKGSMSVVAEIIFGADSRYGSQLENSEFGGFTIAIVYFIFTIFQMYISKNDNKYITILMFLTIIQTTGIYSQTIPRLAYYFVPLFALSFPEAIKEEANQKRKIMQASLLFVFMSFFFMQANSHYLAVTPFKFFWE